MPIAYFAERQTDVFVPALAALLVATVAVVLPVVFAPLLARMRSRRALLAIAGAVAAVALVLTVVEGAAGFAALGEQRDSVQRDIAGRYGLTLTPGQVASLLDGGKVKVVSAGPGTDTAVRTRTVELHATGTDDDYALVEGKRGELPQRA
ncbi:hypothetical protein QDR37_15215 [Amnibacterium sp. CER49]|uniref:hypothetical protein n=1 Tax=Amnibacterium sp. CER49 TaxID=3039161 RepID=UPI0024495C39|nr:hypothetical protein [Amnibacterium sp. CER49]MDH2445300.1 hypothetical protein [Amnibacterium sp. CER49]